jgi:hypothetical protein
MKKHYLIVVAIVALFLSGCGPSTPEPVTDLSQIVGTWKAIRPGLAMIIMPDGTVRQALTVIRINEGEYEEFNILFTDNILEITGLPRYCGEIIGSYAVKTVPSGNLVFTVLQDDCAHRLDHFQAEAGQKGEDLEWARVE